MGVVKRTERCLKIAHDAHGSVLAPVYLPIRSICTAQNLPRSPISILRQRLTLISQPWDSKSAVMMKHSRSSQTEAVLERMGQM